MRDDDLLDVIEGFPFVDSVGSPVPEPRETVVQFATPAHGSLLVRRLLNGQLKFLGLRDHPSNRGTQCFGTVSKTKWRRFERLFRCCRALLNSFKALQGTAELTDRSSYRYAFCPTRLDSHKRFSFVLVWRKPRTSLPVRLLACESAL